MHISQIKLEILRGFSFNLLGRILNQVILGEHVDLCNSSLGLSFGKEERMEGRKERRLGKEEGRKGGREEREGGRNGGKRMTSRKWIQESVQAFPRVLCLSSGINIQEQQCDFYTILYTIEKILCASQN